MAITATDVKALGSELSALSDGFVNIYINIAECLISSDAWGDCYDNALKLMAAHLCTLGGRGGSAGAITQESVGDLSRSYGNINGDGEVNELMLTSYGTMLLQLRRTLFRTPFCV